MRHRGRRPCVGSPRTKGELCQTQYDAKDQERKVHTLCRMDDDAHPGVPRNRQLGNAYRKTPLMTDARIPQGWWAWYEP